MNKNNFNEVIYQLTVEDLQNVAKEELERDLTKNEIDIIKEKIGDYIDWMQAIENTISQYIKK